MIGGEVWVWITSTIISRTFDLSLNCLFVWASTRINLHACFCLCCCSAAHVSVNVLPLPRSSSAAMCPSKATGRQFIAIMLCL